MDFGEFETALARLGLKNFANLSGVSPTTILKMSLGQLTAGPRVVTRLARAIESFKVSLVMDAGASQAQSQAAARLTFRTVDKYVDRMTKIMDAITRDRYIEGEGYSREEIREFIDEGMARSEKTVRELYEKYVG